MDRAAVQKRHRQTLESLGAPKALLAQPALSPDDFEEVLRACEPRIPNLAARVFPSTFDAESARALPRPLAARWPSLLEHLRIWKPRTALLLAPLWYQLEAPFHAACEAAGSAYYLNDPANLPLAAAAIAGAQADCVVSDARSGAALASLLFERKIPGPRAWLLAYDAGAPTWSELSGLFSGAQVAREVHLAPGIAALVQCPELARTGASAFHLSPDFMWEFENDAAYLTDAQVSPLPLVRYRFPAALKETGRCACGSACYERL